MTLVKTDKFLAELGLQDKNYSWSTGQKSGHSASGEYQSITSPADGRFLGSVQMTSMKEYSHVVATAEKGFEEWRMWPAPKRGEVVRQIADALRKYKDPLGRLVSMEMGKIHQEGLGEVQEMIDICDFAVGLSRQLYGLTMHSERPLHRMYEQYHPLGTVGIISAFNFPVAVWAWNSMLAAVCGDATIWKPSEKTPLTAIACMNIIQDVLKENNVPEGIFSLVIGDREIGQAMAADKKVALLSATGSTRMGRAVAQSVSARLGKFLLELGGNNAIIITPNANLGLALPAVLFGSVGTCGQRCTSTRRLIVHESMYDQVRDSLVKAHSSLRNKVGHPLDPATLIGPLIDKDAVNNMQKRLKTVVEEGGNVLLGGEVLSGEGFETGTYVVPAVVEAKNEYVSVQEETFAPILYLMKYTTLEDAMAQHNNVPQGLSSSIFSENMKEIEYFLSHKGSDCGIANVNIGTSGAEIGGAFGGEKDTGGGRESGSDAWKVYMRRQTNTLNWSDDLPLAQGIVFDI
jgi:aldehyde dehydrogenase (NAD+)